jgi:Flp pilus assembly protein TadD
LRHPTTGCTASISPIAPIRRPIRIIGPTVEILNDQGFSYMLRGDYTRAHKKLQEAQAKDPSNPYVQANLQLLEESYREGKAIQ